MMSEDGYILGQNTFRKTEQKPPRQLRHGGSASRRRAVISGSCHEADNDHFRCSCCRCQTVRSGSAHAVRIGWPYCAHTRTPVRKSRLQFNCLFCPIVNLNTFLHINPIDNPAIGLTCTFKCLEPIDAVDFHQRHHDTIS